MKKFIYFIVDINGKCLQVVNGTVQLLSQLKQLPEAPDGNQEIAIGWERSPVYHGNIRNFSLDLGFVMESAFMLRDQWYKYNMDLRRFLLIKRLTYEWTALTFKEYYKQLYKGELDFSTGDDSQGEHRFNIGIMEGGLQKLIKANEGTDYEIPFDIDAKNVKMDGLYIQGTYRWLLPEDSFQNEKYVSMYQLPNDNPVPGFVIFDVQKGGAAGAITSDVLNYFGEFTQDISDVHLTGMFAGVNWSFASELIVELLVYNTLTDTTRLTIDLAPDDPYPPAGNNIIVDETFDALKGDRLFLKVGQAPTSFIEMQESRLQLEMKSKPLPSTIQGFTIYDLGVKLLEKMGIPASSFESTLLTAKNIILTSGDGIRSIVGAAIKTNWRDYWKAVDVYCKAQLTITDKVRIEERHSAYDSTKPAKALGIVKAWKCTYALDMMWTSVKVGHADPQTDDTNGKFDFNSHLIFTTPIKGIVDKQLDLQTNYKASPWEIEAIRANYEGKTTTDKNTDNNVYALAVLPDSSSDQFNSLVTFAADGTPFAPGQPFANIVSQVVPIAIGMKLRFVGSILNTGDYTVKDRASWFFGQLIIFNEPVVDESINVVVQILEGQYYTLDRTPVVTQLTVPDVSQDIKDSLYNVPLSPKRLFNLHKGWIAGALVGYSADKVVFASSLRNKEMIADGIIEKADVVVNDLGSPDFLPRYFEFDTVSPVDMTAELDADPNPIFEPTWDDNNYTGFFIRGGIALNDLEEQTFKLLACPENNLLNLI